MNIAYDIAHKHSSCRLCWIGKWVWAIIIKDNKIICYWYNGILDRFPICTSDTCLRLKPDYADNSEICYWDCAEKRAFINAYLNNININGSTIYITRSPCISCTKMIINLWIKEVVFDELYKHHDFSSLLLEKAGIPYRKISNFYRKDH